MSLNIAVHNRRSVGRLSRYRRALIRMREMGVSKVVSEALGEAAGATSSQVRKDFSLFGIAGNKKGGYQIDLLLSELETILKKNRPHKVIIAGMGNIGNALMSYRTFEQECIQIVAGFDIDPAKINKKNKVPVYPIGELYGVVQREDVEIGIIAVPAVTAQEVCDLMQEAGIKGILNFAPIRLRVREDVVITHVNVLMKLENLIYFVDAKQPVE